MAGGREAVTRLVVIAAAVALGVGLLLTTLAGRQRGQRPERPVRVAEHRSDVDRRARRRPAVVAAARRTTSTASTIGRIDVAATGPDSPVPPGIPRTARARASSTPRPALADAAARPPRPTSSATATPAGPVGTIGRPALPVAGHPDHRHRPHPRRARRAARRVQAARSPPSPSDCTACRSARHRRHRPHPVGVVAGGAAVPGADLHRHRDPARRRPPGAALRRDAPGRRDPAADLGRRRGRVDRRRRRRHRASASACSSLFRGPLARRSRSPACRSSPATCRSARSTSLLVALGVPVGAAVAARVALRRVRISPLGVTRRVTPRPPRAYRLIPLAARPRRARLLRRPAARRRPTARLAVFLPGLLLIMAGLVVAGRG